MNSPRCSLVVAVFSLATILPLTADAQNAMKVSVNEVIFANPKNAEKKYGGATLEVTNTLFEFGAGPKGEPAILLRATPENSRSLTCVIKDGPEPWAVYVPGQQVKVVGKWTPAATPHLFECEVTPIGKAIPPHAITAEQLAKNAANERDMEKYRGKPLLVTGKVLKTAVEKSGFTSVVLEGSGKFAIYAQAPIAAQGRAKDLKIGDTATIAGQFSFMDAEKGEVFLTRCWPVTKK